MNDVASTHPLFHPLGIAAIVLVTLALGKWIGAKAGNGAWQVRCLTCNRTALLSDVGGARIGARSIYKRTLARCSACGRLRLAAIERRPDEVTSADKGDCPTKA